MKLRYSLTLAFVQMMLVVTSVIIDQNINHGLGEGNNQVIANLVSNIEYFIKAGLGLSDIVNFRFIFITSIIGVFFWFAAGVFIDHLFYSLQSKLLVSRTLQQNNKLNVKNSM